MCRGRSVVSPERPQRPAVPANSTDESKLRTGQIAQLDPDRPVLRVSVGRGQDRIVSGRCTDVEAPRSRVGLIELDRASAQNYTVFSLQYISPSGLKRIVRVVMGLEKSDQPLVNLWALPLHLASWTCGDDLDTEPRTTDKR
jgi:hypothetical protein